MGKRKSKLALFAGALGLVGALAVPAALAKVGGEVKARDYNALFDVYLDDFSTDDLSSKATLDGGAIHSGAPYLEVKYEDGNQDAAQNVEEHELYKLGANPELIGGTSGQAASNGIVLTISTDDEAALADVSLRLQTDGLDRAIYTSDKWMDPDAEASLDVAGKDYSTPTEVVISLSNTIGDEDYYPVQVNGDDVDGQGEPSTTLVESIVNGFHLVYDKKSEMSAGSLKIHKVERFASGVVTDRTTLDDFRRADNPGGVVTNIPGSYWIGSAGAIVRSHADLPASGGSYQVADHAQAGLFENVVLGLSGELPPELYPVYSDGENLTVGTVISAPKDELNADTFADADGSEIAKYTINFANSGVATPEDIAGIKVVAGAGGAVGVYEVFLTNMETKSPALRYPTVDLTNGNYLTFSEFNFTKPAFATSYENAVAGITQGEIDNNLNYGIAYSGAESVSANGNELVLADASSVNFVLGATNSQNAASYRYLAIGYAIEEIPDETPDMTGFYVSAGGSDIRYQDWVSGFDLPAGKPNEVGNPYAYMVGDVKYSLALIDTEEFDGMTLGAEITLHVDAAINANIHIDQILYVNDKADVESDYSAVGDATIAAAAAVGTDAAYNGYYGGKIAPNAAYYSFEVTATVTTGTGMLRDMRMALDAAGNGPASGTPWVKDGAIILADGEPLEVTAVDDGETHVITIDLMATFGSDTFSLEAKNLLTLDAADCFHVRFHFGDMSGEATGAGTLKIANAKEATKGQVYRQELLGVSAEEPNTVSEWEVQAKPAATTQIVDFWPEIGKGVYQNYLEMTFVNEGEAPIANALVGLVVNNGGAERFFNASGTNGVYLADGTQMNERLDLPVGETTIVLDLAKMGFNMAKASTFFQLVINDWGVPAAAIFTLKDVAFVDVVASPFAEMDAYVNRDVVAPVITYNGPTTGAVGVEIELDYSVDDADATVGVAVVLGSGAEAVNITVTDDAFTPQVEGTYTVTITATDVAGNVATEVAQIVVSDDSEDPTLNITTPAVASTGSNVDITYTVSDNVSEATNIAISIVVVRVTEEGDSDPLTLGDSESGKFFSVNEAGTYKITVTATDEAGNVATDVLEVVVTDPVTLPVWASALIAVGAILLAGGIATAVIIIVKKKS